jgi:hypothetical protein
MGAAQHKFERVKEFDSAELRDLYGRYLTTYNLNRPQVTRHYNTQTKIFQTKAVPKMGYFFIPNERMPKATNIWKGAGIRVAQFLWHDLNPYGEPEMILKNLDESAEDHYWSSMQLDLLHIFSDDVIDGTLISTKLVKALRAGGILSIVTHAHGSEVQETNAISDIVKVQCLQYLTSMSYVVTTTNVEFICDVFLFLGEGKCNLKDADIAAYIKKEHFEYAQKQSHKRQQTPLAVLVDKLPLYTINRLSTETELAVLANKLELQDIGGYSYHTLCFKRLMQEHNFLEQSHDWRLDICGINSKDDEVNIQGLECERFYVSNKFTETSLFEALQHLGEQEKLKWIPIDLSIFQERTREGTPSKTLLHGNLLLVDIAAKKCYRYEPWGQASSTVAKKAEQAVDLYLKKLFNTNFYEYIAPSYIFAGPGPQAGNIAMISGADTPEGWCSAWSLWFLHVIATKQRAPDFSESTTVDTARPLGLDDFVPVMKDDFDYLYMKMMESMRPHRHRPCWYGGCLAESEKLKLARSYFIAAFSASMVRVVYPSWDGRSNAPLLLKL